MKALQTLSAVVIPLDCANVDTDAIIPKQYLKSIHRAGFGINLFDNWRYLDPGESGQDHHLRRPNPEFVLNHPRYLGAQILLGRKNFGCGSSREHAVWALMDYGIRVVIAPSFAEIFATNCFKNGLLPIVLEERAIDRLFGAVAEHEGYTLTINVGEQTVTAADNEVYRFELDPYRKHCLVNGLDDIGLTLQHEQEIRGYEVQRKQQAPWLFSEL